MAKPLYYLKNAFGLQVAGVKNSCMVIYHTLQVEDSNGVGLIIFPSGSSGNGVYDISSCLRVTNCGVLIAMGEMVYIPETKKIIFKLSPTGRDCIDLREFPSDYGNVIPSV